MGFLSSPIKFAFGGFPLIEPMNFDANSQLQGWRGLFTQGADVNFGAIFLDSMLFVMYNMAAIQGRRLDDRKRTEAGSKAVLQRLER